MGKFKEAYRKAKTWADLDEAIKHLNPTQMRELVFSLNTVKAATGIDMRQDFFLGVLKNAVKNL